MSDRKMDRHHKRPLPRACCRCRVVKDADRFPWGRKGVRKSGVCWACTEEAAWDHYHRHVLTRTTWIDPATGERVRICVTCEEVKPLEGNFFVMQKAGSIDSKGYRVMTPRYARYCKPCHNALSYAAHRVVMADAARRERRKAQRCAASKRWRERNLDRARTRSKEWKAKIMADPVRHAKYLEDVRMNYRLKREREGKPVRESKLGRRQPTAPSYLPSEPLVNFISGVLEHRTALAHTLGESVPTLEAVCAEMGVTSRTWRRWREGEQPQVRVGVAEKVFLRAGVPWHAVYSYDDHAATFLAAEVPS